MTADPPGGRTEEERAVELAYRAVSHKERTVAELRSWLERKRIEPGAIEHAVAELSAAGYLDDARYAHRFAEDKRELERWGRERIERELLRRGVPRELVEAATAASGRADELSAAVSLLAERGPTIASERDRDRAWRLLVRKGYEPELAYDAVREHGRRAA